MSESGKAVFLSYASQDAEAAKRICTALREAGVEVWFDLSELVGGDAWDQKIRKQIKECALLIPIISENTQSRTEGYFRLEWRLADQRTHLMAKGRAFLLPVVIDDTRDAEAHVPDSFMEVQWTRLPGGETPPAFAARVKKLLSNEAGPVSDRLRGRSAPSEAGQRPALPGKSRPWFVPVILGTVAIAIAAVWLTRKPAPAPANEPNTVAAPPAIGLSNGLTDAQKLVPAPSPGDQAKVEQKSIAVLPFENRSAGGEDAAFLADGIHEDLINTLSRVPGLKVMSRTAVQRFRGMEKSLPDIAETLRISHVVEAGVQRAGSQVRINVQLVQASDGRTVWSERYDRVLSADGIFALQEEITGAVAKALKLQLDSAPGRKLITGTTGNLEAYEAFLKGRQIWKTPGSSHREAIAQFKRAVELDPNFAIAFGAMAEAYASLANTGQEAPAAAFPLAKAVAERALAIDPRCTQALTALGEHAFHYEWDWDKADRLLRQALVVDPNYASAYERLGGHLRMMNRIAESKAMEQRKLELEPDRPLSRQLDRMNEGLEAREFPAAVALARQIAEQNPDSFVGSRSLGRALRQAGQMQEAVQVLEKGVAEFPDALGLYEELGLSLAAAGQTSRARDVIARLGAIRETRFVSPLLSATIATALHDRDLAFAEIERAFQVHDPFLPSLGGDKDFALLKDDPRFREVLKRLKLDTFFPETAKQ